MEVYLDSTESKRIDLCMDYRVNEGAIKERRFVVRAGNTQRSFESFLEAVEYYKSLPNTLGEAFEVGSAKLKELYGR